MHYALRIMQGRPAEVIGDVKKTRRRETATDNDRKMRTFGFANAAKRRVGELDTESVGLLQAYSNGVNDYFAEHGDDLPELFETTGLKPETWTPADCLLSWWHLAQFFATDGTRDLIRYRNLVDGGAGHRRALPARARGLLPPEGMERVVQDESGMSHFLKTVIRRLDEDSNAKITPLEKRYVERLLVDAWTIAESKWGPDPALWNACAREEVAHRKMAFHGSLDGFPSIDPAHDLAWPALECVDGATVFSQAAQAYVQMGALGPRG